MHSVVLDSVHPQTSSYRGLLLIVAALLLLLALRMLREALLPLREIFRVLWAAIAVVTVVLLAFALIVASLVMT